MTVLVWGARGFIGTNLVSHLLASEYHVRVLSRPNPEPRPSWAFGVEWTTLDPDHRAAAFDRALSDVDVVFNLAGSSGAVASNNDPLESLAANCQLQLEFLTACARARRQPHVVFASSRLVYAHAGSRPVAEDAPLGPLSVYAAHKLCIEQYHRIYALRGALTFTACRISNPYGLDRCAPAKGYGFVNALIQRALADRPLLLFGTGLQLRDYVYIDDLVAFLRLCAEVPAARNEVLNAGLGASVSILEAATAIQQHLGGGPIEHRPWPAEFEAVESGDFVVDIAKARALLGYAPRFGFAAGISDVRQRTASLSPSLFRDPGGAGIDNRVGIATSIQG
jgi:UDP-glucose 4-epimerase